MKFDGFSAQSFERLVQALASAVIGPDVVVFGSGRDGGREATFEGSLPNFSSGSWNGYTVIQAKCKEKLLNDHRDASWLCDQLKADLEKFVEHPEYRPPEYYLLCTNVELSSVPKSGGKARIEKIFKSYSARLKLKGWHVWSADELRSLLEGATEVRTSYTAWLTPSDVLSALINKIAGAEVKRLLPLALARDLRLERDVRLRDAGQETEQPIYLENVFIDLPVEGALTSLDFQQVEDGTLEPTATYHGGSSWTLEDGPRADIGCVHAMMDRATDRLDPATLFASKAKRRDALPNRIVILGGPGQGKSTLGQFIAQLSRAKLLNTLDKGRLAPDIEEAVTQILTQGQLLNLDLTGPVRLPFRLDLPALADAISAASEGALSVLGFIAQKLGRDLGSEVDVDAIRKLLSQLPWIIIFDGLDEVPPSANRQEVIRAIEGFWDEVHQCNADVLGVVTTRPQGYNHDFDPRQWQHWHLQPLNKDVAVGYARKIAEIRIPDPQRQEAIIKEIESACVDPATSLLTTSPLQVAILFGISYLKGSIPQDRWELFDKYYSLLRDREAQKPGRTSTFILNNKRMIDALHHECGWILQVEAESAGRTGAYLTEVQFRNIIHDMLAAEEHEPTEIEGLTNELARIATDRLVLLATRIEGRISFDVRSLQEYMAAAKLAGSDQTLFDQRLRAIASSAHWRHVFRIAASKVFSVAELGHLRNLIVGICDALNSGDFDDATAFVRTGSALALDLLADGVCASAPKFQRLLAARALGLLEAGAPAFDPRLKGVYDGRNQDKVSEVITRLVKFGTITQAKAAWRLLLVLADQNNWAVQLAHSIAPDGPAELLELFSDTDPRIWPTSFKEKVLDAQKIAGPRATADFFADNMMPRNDEDGKKTDFTFAGELLGASSRKRGFDAVAVRWFSGVGSTINHAEIESELVSSIPADLSVPPWGILAAFREFAGSPSPKTLSTAIKIYSEGVAQEDEDRFWLHRLPWVLQSVLSDYHEGTDANYLIEMAQSGGFGSLSQWKDAEERFRIDGITADDVRTWSSGLYLNKDIGVRGAPRPHSFHLRPENIAFEPGFFENILRDVKSHPKQRMLLWLMALSSRGSARLDQTMQALDIYFRYSGGKDAYVMPFRLLFTFHSEMVQDPRALEFADKVGRSGDASITTRNIRPLAQAFSSDQSKRGLLPLVAASLRHSRLAPDELITALPPSAFCSESDDEPAVAAAVAVLRLLTDRWTAADINSLVDDLFVSGSTELAAIGLVAVRQTTKTREEEWKKILLSLAKREYDFHGAISSIVFDRLNSNVSGYSTHLSMQDVSEKLCLPAGLRHLSH